jgi:hypothetical protein
VVEKSAATVPLKRLFAVASASAGTRPTQLTYKGRITIAATTGAYIHVGFGDENKAGARAVIPFEITLREVYPGSGVLQGKTVVGVTWTGDWAGRMRLPREKQASGSVTGSGPVTVSALFPAARPDEVSISLDGFAGHKVEFQPDPKAVLDPGFNFLLGHEDLLWAALMDAEEKGFGRFKVEGGSFAIRVGGGQMGILARQYLYSKGSYSLTATLRLVRASGGRQPPVLFMDGKQLLPDVPPVIVEGRTLAPLRVIGEALGADVFWDGRERRVLVVAPDKRRILLRIGEKGARILVPRQGETGGGAAGLPEAFDAQEIELDVPAQVVDGRTLVPLRFIAESLGVQVQWDGAAWAVRMTAGAEERSAETSNEEAVSHFLAAYQSLANLANCTADTVDVWQDDLSRDIREGHLNRYQGDERLVSSRTVYSLADGRAVSTLGEYRLVGGRVYVKAESDSGWSVQEGGPEKYRGVLGTPQAAGELNGNPSLVIWASETVANDGSAEIQAVVGPELLERLSLGTPANTGKIRFVMKLRADGSVESLSWDYVRLGSAGLELVSGAIRNVTPGTAVPVSAP